MMCRSLLRPQMRLLRQRGHEVVALTRSELADTAVPPWSDVQASPAPASGPQAARRAGMGCADCAHTKALDGAECRSNPPVFNPMP